MVYGDLSYKGPDYFKKDANAIVQKIELLLRSHEGDWFFDREFDCDLRKYLFDEYKPWTLDSIKFDLRICFSRNVPEITLLDETEILYDPDLRTYILKLVFEIEGIEGIFTFDYNFKIIQ
jgi:hypothetical protein